MRTKVVERDLHELLAAGRREDALFEIVVSATTEAGTGRRRQPGLLAVTAARDAKK